MGAGFSTSGINNPKELRGVVLRNEDYFQTLKREIDETLDRLTRFPETVPSRLREAVRYSLLAPGKRLRPILCLLATELAGGDRNEALIPACAIEMIHSYSLIHDDLPAMDNDDLRRGRPTSHKAFDEATAILAGDALLTLAFETVASIPEKRLAGSLTSALATAAGVGGMVGGQADDIFYEKKIPGGIVTDSPIDLLRAIHRRKTGAMIQVPLRMGGLIAGLVEESGEISALLAYGESLGLAFQITDDLLDFTGDESLMGKRLQKDADKGKLTFPVLLGMEESREVAKREIVKAKKALDLFPNGPVAKDVLIELADFLLVRQN